jgi:hypothetical protein
MVVSISNWYPWQPACTYKHTDKKITQLFSYIREIQNGPGARSYMTNSLLIYGEIFAHFSNIRKPFIIYDSALLHSEFPNI